jgi:hypothetical protein
MNFNQIQIRHSLTYGAIFGVSIVILLLLLYIFGMTNNASLITLAPLLYVIGAHISVKHHRDRLNDGLLSFGKAFGTSLLTCVIMGSIWAVYEYFLYKFLLPGLLAEQIALAEDMYLNLGFSEEYVEKINITTTPFTIAFGYVTNSLIFGSILSLVIAVFLKRNNTNPLMTDTDEL